MNSEIFQRHGPAGIAVALNLLILFVFAVVHIRQEIAGNPDAISFSIDSAAPPPAAPAGDSSAAAIAAQAAQMMTEAQTATPLPSSVTATNPTEMRAPVFHGPKSAVAHADTAQTSGSGVAEGANTTSALSPITTQAQREAFEMPKGGYVAFQFIDQVMEEMQTEESFKKVVHKYAGQIINGRYPLEEALEKTDHLPDSNPYRKVLNRVKEIFDKAESRALGRNARVGRSQGVESGVTTAADGSIDNYVRLGDVPGNAYGSATGKKYRAQGDPFKNQKILILQSEAMLPIMEEFKSVNYYKETLKLLDTLQKNNSVTTQISHVFVGGFTTSKSYKYTVNSSELSPSGGIILGATRTSLEISIAKALEAEIANPQHDVVIILGMYRFRENLENHGTRMVTKLMIDEAKAFMPYLHKSGLRIYHITLAKHTNLPQEYINTLKQMGGGYYRLDSFLDLIERNRNSRL